MGVLHAFKFDLNGQTNIENQIGVNGAIFNSFFYLNGFSNMRISSTYQTLDKRFKTNINSLKNSLEMLLSLQSTSYNFRNNEFPERHFEEGLRMGSIAQDLQNVFSELVKEGADGYLAVSFVEIISLLSEGIKELIGEVDIKDAKIQSLKKRLSIVRAKLKMAASITKLVLYLLTELNLNYSKIHLIHIISKQRLNTFYLK